MGEGSAGPLVFAAGFPCWVCMRRRMMLLCTVALEVIRLSAIKYAALSTVVVVCTKVLGIVEMP